MQANRIILPQEIYSEYLKTVNNIRFTRREIDIIAYLCSGRSAKTIASFLSITPKTIEAHMRNIMLKLECNSRDGIIDFIEKSDKFLFIKKYYTGLLAQACFEKQLLKVAQLLNSKHPSCLLVYWHEQKQSVLIARTLQHHLKLAGIEISIEVKEGHRISVDALSDIEQWQTNYALYFFPSLLLSQSKEEDTTQRNLFQLIKKVSEKQNCIITLFLDKEAKTDLERELCNIEYIDFFFQENYYSFTFLILKKLFPETNFNEIILEFKNQYESIYDSTAKPLPPILLNTNFLKARSLIAKTMPYIYSFVNAVKRRKVRVCVMSALCFGTLWFGFSILISSTKELNQENIHHIETSVRPDLVIPTQSTFLDRPHLMTKIGESLKGPQEIQTVALVGIGGAGKTTIARYYARQQNTNVTWEINAETRASLNNAFENLADALSKTEEERKKLKELKDIKVVKERETKIISFVREKLKSLSNWLLIYDNVNKFGNIQEYFPHDAGVWGKGRVIILSRDKNIENNNNVNNTIYVSELPPEEKLALFTKIMTNGNINKFDSIQNEQTKKFLSDIPPFPLDVSIAAYYLKATNVSYRTYLEKLMQYDKDFENVQQIFLEEASNYTKTRYGIITLSLQHISNSHEDFRDLLLFISLLDSQNIPRDILDKYKNSTIVDNFIYNLKKHSFVTNEAVFSGETPTFSMHRSTQAIVLAYLTKLLNSEKNNRFIEDIGTFFKNYVAEAIDKEDFTKINVFIRHCEVFLSHHNLLTDFITASVSSELGNVYRDLGNYEKAKQLFEKSLIIYKKNSYENHPWFAQSLGRLGCVYGVQGNYEKAKQLLEKSLVIYRKNSYEDNPWFARTLGWLGNVYKEQGRYEKAKQLFEESLGIYKKNSYESHPWFAQALGRLGSIYREQCDYEKAKQLLEESLVIYRKNSYENNPWFARALAWLGSVYRDLGNYEKAKELLEESLVIYRKNSHENHPWFAWTLVWLGSLYREQGDYEKAKLSLEESLVIYRKNHFENHPWFARALAGLGNVYREQGRYEKAKQLFESSLMIYKKNSYENHPWYARTLEQLGNIYRDQGDYEKAKQSLEESLVIYRKNRFENHPWFALVLVKLGTVYRELGDYDKAKDLFERSFETYEKTCGKNHVDVAPVILNLGLIHMLKGDMKTAENLINKALQIFQIKKPAESHVCLESLSDLYLKKVLQLTNKEDSQQSEDFKRKALSFLNQALEVTKAHFPKNSPHIIRIESKIQNFK